MSIVGNIWHAVHRKSKFHLPEKLFKSKYPRHPVTLMYHVISKNFAFISFCVNHSKLSV